MNEKDKQAQATELPVHLTAPPILLPPPVPAADNKPLDRVKSPTEKKRSRELER
jgi:hypothetical protein